jgi:two-component sensor histidine kinase
LFLRFRTPDILGVAALRPKGTSAMCAPSHIDRSIEPSPRDESADLISSALEERIRQQEILAELGVTALQGAPFDQLLTETARLSAEGLHAEFSKVLEHISAENRLLIRAGVGWDPDVIGVVSIGAGVESPAGFALCTGKPVISNQLEIEERFRTPELLRRHGVRRAMNVILQGNGKPFGVLEVDSRSGREFVKHDLAFLQGAANLLGMAIERERYERKLKAALERDEALLKEMNHRVKNSLAIVASMLRAQARDAGSPELTAQLNEASHHVVAIGKVHDQLAHGSDLERMDIGKYIEALCRDLDESVARCDVNTDADTGIVIDTDRALSTALIVNELITNAARHAYPGESGGKISVRVYRSSDGGFSISVRDEGTGAPADLDLRKAKGLGMRIIDSFVQQLNATLTVLRHDPGAEFVVSIPLRKL